jgi:hypothetical protein
VSGALYGARRLRTDARGTGHAGRGRPSQHARGGTEANSGLPGHPTVAEPILLEVWNLRGRLGQPRSSSDLPRERFGLRKDLRCLPPSGSLPGSYSQVTAVWLPPESSFRHGRAFFANQGLVALTGSDPSIRGGSVPPAGKQPDPIGMTRGAPHSFYELVAR